MRIYFKLFSKKEGIGIVARRKRKGFTLTCEWGKKSPIKLVSWKV